MAHEAHCPQCDTILERQGEGIYHCQKCGEFKHHILCDVCDNEVETLKACGAVNHFCQHCKALKSKSAVVHTYVAA